MLTDGLEWCDVFIRLSFWRHPFTAEHTLLRNISINVMKKQTHPNLGWPEDDYIFIFGWTIALSSNSPSRASPCISNRSLFVIITTIVLALTSIKLLHWLLARFTKDCSIYNSSLTQLNRYLTRLGYTGFIASVLDHYKMTTKLKQI